MLRDELGHFEHAHHALPAKDRLECGIGVHVALVLRILEPVLLDVRPKPLHDLRAGHRALPDDGRQCRRHGELRRERGVRLSCGLLRRNLFDRLLRSGLLRDILILHCRFLRHK